MRLCVFCFILGLVLLLTGIFLPRDWFDALPRSEADLPWVWQDASTELTRNLPMPPVKGVTLLQISFIIEGLALLWMSRKNWSFSRLKDAERLPPLLNTPENEKGNYLPASLWILTAITLLGFSLRVFRLDADLWLDEIAPLLFYSQMPTFQVITTYIASNNHLLNTLLMKLSLNLFGEVEWAVRLPAMLFGLATIPAFYWTARLILSMRASLSAALLLAVSYHHIFFSQNARGYTAYLFFSLISSVLLVKGLKEDDWRCWLFYIIAMLLNFASLLTSGFVLAAQILVGIAALLMVKRRGNSPAGLMRRLIGVFGIIIFLVFQIYSIVIPQVYVYSQTVYSDPSTGYKPFSGEFLTELIRGISAGFGTGTLLGLAPVALITGFGFLVLFKRSWQLIAALTLPLILTAGFLALQGLTFSPRFFLLALPVALLSVVQGIETVSQTFAKILKRKATSLPAVLATSIVVAGCFGSLLSLRNYYSIPKQSYRASLQYLKSERKPDEKIIVIHLAEKGYRFYADRFGLLEGVDFFSVRSLKTFDDVLQSQGDKVAFLVTTFPRALHLTYPDLEARIHNDWKQIRTFPGTVGDGEITIWKRP